MNRERYAEQLSIENMLDRMGARVFASHPGCSLDTTLVKTGGRPRYIHRLGTHDEIWGLLRVTWEKKPDSDEQRPTAIEFQLQLGMDLVPFRIEPDVKGMKRALNADPDTPGSFDQDQARRTAWRLWKEWLNAVLAFRDTEQARLDQLLLGFGVTPDGRTVYDRITDDRKLLRSPNDRTYE